MSSETAERPTPPPIRTRIAHTLWFARVPDEYRAWVDEDWASGRLVRRQKAFALCSIVAGAVGVWFLWPLAAADTDLGREWLVPSVYVPLGGAFLAVVKWYPFSPHDADLQWSHPGEGSMPALIDARIFRSRFFWFVIGLSTLIGSVMGVVHVVTSG